LTAKETSAANDSLRIKTLPQKIVANKTLILMCLPAIIFFLVFSYMPMPGAYVAFTRFDYGKGIFASQFIGLRNFQFLFKSGQLALLLKNTVLYNLAFIILGNMLQLTFAVMLNEVQSRRYKKTTQSMMFLPYFISPVLVSLIVYNMINYDFGFLSSLIRAGGGVMPKLYSAASAWPFIIILVHLWQSTGYGTVIYFAAITSIDESLFEAAKVDGANGFQRIRYITLPSILPTIILMACLSLGSILNAGFDQVLVLYNPSVMRTGDIIDTYVYRVGLIGEGGMINYGLASAVGLMKSVVGFFLIVASYWLAGKFANYRIF